MDYTILPTRSENGKKTYILKLNNGDFFEQLTEREVIEKIFDEVDDMRKIIEENKRLRENPDSSVVVSINKRLRHYGNTL